MNKLLGKFVVLLAIVANAHYQTECNVETCPLLQGVCYEGKCVCARGYTTVTLKHNEAIDCNYKQKSHLVAFFLEFFFPIGAGHLYAEKAIMAGIKFALFMFFCFGLVGQMCCMNLKVNKYLLTVSVLNLLFLVLWIALQVTDVVCYAFNYYSDGNGVDMI